MSTPGGTPLNAWEHAALIVGAVLAVIGGFLDLTLWHQHLTAAGDVSLISVGLAALGVKGVGGLPT